jgi:hypothetical protein
LFVFVPDVDIHSARLPISDNRRERRKFTTGLRHYPTKHFPELEKTLEAVYRQWRGV